MLNRGNEKNNFKDEVDDTLNSFFKSTMNVDLLKNQIKKSYNIMTPSDFGLEKELAKTKLNINIKEINDENKYLKKRNWDSLDDNKIQYLEQKVEKIYKGVDKNRVNNIIMQINKCNLDNFYKNFRPKCNDKTIGSISSLDFLVETTFNSSPNHYDIMITDRDQLNNYIYKFRSVLGDEDCFYRGFIFSFLENIILTNNIMLMKELLILYHEKINLKNELIKDKEYLLIMHKMNIEIVSVILYYLINQMESDKEKAYKSLLKVFLYSPDFDFGIIYFTKYLIYEFISANEDKIFSREFQVEIGCLLPEDYVIDKGDKNIYMFEDYFSLNLMKTKTFAEKIVIYIAPYVFNTNINILIYDFGINGAPSTIQEKKFLSDNDTTSQIQINLIFRKAHYDIYYKQNYYQEFRRYFNILQNTKEDIQIINGNFLKQKKEDNDNNNNINKINDLNNTITQLKQENKTIMKKYEDAKNIIKQITLENNYLKNKFNHLQPQLNSQDNKNNDPNEMVKLYKKIDELKEKINRYPFILEKNENMLSIVFISISQNVNYSMICKNTDTIHKLEEELYKEYPNLAEGENYFLCKGTVVNKFKKFEELNIKNGDAILINQREI